MQEMDKKFIESKTISDYEILTDDGFKDVCALHKTIDYDMYLLKTDNKELKCADNHIVFFSDGRESYVKDLTKGDMIKTVDGIENVILVEKLNYEKHMWDFELTGNNVKYYTNGILSHNTTYIRKLISILSEKKTIIYVPTYMMSQMADPELITFISHFKDTILSLEDSENILANTIDDRTQAVTNILNMTDGLLNDSMQVQIIATFNTSKKVIDAALTRAGRLQVDYKFKKLKQDQVQKIYKKLEIDKVATKSMSLAEIYEGHTQLIDDLDDNSEIGF